MPPLETLFLSYNYSVIRETLAPATVWNMGSGAINTRRKWARPLSRFRLRALDLTKLELDELYGFAAYHQGDKPFWLEAITRDGFEFSHLTTPILVGYGTGAQDQFFMPNRHLLNTPPGCIGYWMLNEGTGTTTSDKSGRGNTGFLGNAFWATRNVPILSNAVGFNGTNSGISIPPNGSVLDGFPGLTLEAWIWLGVAPGAGTNMTIIGKVTANRRSYWLGILSDRRVEFDIYERMGNVNAVGSVTAIPLQTWTHVAATWAPGEGVSVVINGVLNNRTASAFQRVHQSSALLTIGYDEATASWFNGVIDDVRVWAYARSPAEINAARMSDLAEPIQVYVDGVAQSLAAGNVNAGLLRTVGNPGNNRRITATYNNRYKCVFVVEGDVLLSQENFARQLFHADGIVLQEVIP